MVTLVNKYHPELRKGEVLLMNTSDDGWALVGHQTKRKGEIAYDIHNNPVDGLFPVFVQRDELVNKGINVVDDGDCSNSKDSAVKAQPARSDCLAFSYDSKTNVIRLGDYGISIESFLAIARCVLINADLKPNDPRLQFVKYVQSLKQEDGYHPDRKRLRVSKASI